MDTDRVGVRTYVPEYQKEEWKEHADELDMSQAEFVRSMVQAGRKSFEFRGQERTGPSNPEKTGSRDVNPGGKGMKDHVLDVLDSDTHSDWEELVTALTDDIEERLDDALSSLQRDNRVRYSGRHGGYTLVEDEH